MRLIFHLVVKYQTSPWLQTLSNIGKRRTQGTDFKQKMKLMCTQAEIPGTSFVESSVTGHHQGITEAFPNLRNFPPLDLVFYVDADHVILEVFEKWMTYINPIFDSEVLEIIMRLHDLIIQKIIKKRFILQNLREILL